MCGMKGGDYGFGFGGGGGRWSIRAGGEAGLLTREGDREDLVSVEEGECEDQA